MLRGKTSSSKHNHNNNNLNYNITNAITIVKQKTIISKRTFYLNETITSVTLSRESKRKENNKKKIYFLYNKYKHRRLFIHYPIAVTYTVQM